VNLHETADAFVELIQATAAHYSIPELYVEKDYWVTKALKRLSESAFAAQIVFKGGTSLSKAHRLIRRFSSSVEIPVAGVLSADLAWALPASFVFA
jgi:predicted nucleotidyltransferase component of viral defense system